MNDKCLTVLHEMLHDRGFMHTSKVNAYIEISENNSGEHILIYFLTDSKISVKKMKDVKKEIDKNIFNTLILIYKESVTSFAKQYLVSDFNNLHIQLFSEKELMINITKHELNPKFRKLSNEEKCIILAKYNCKLQQFPYLLSSDPISKYYAYLPGDLIEIQRTSPTAGIHTLYRLVV